jgi:hypothetical protein
VDLAIGPYLAAVLLLAYAGIEKLVRPGATRDAMHALHLPHRPIAVRAVGGLELAIAVVGLAAGTAGAIAVTFMYAALAVVALVLWRAAPATPCGCLGASPTPASGVHVFVNGAAAIVALLAASAPHPFTVLAEQPLAGVPFVVLAICVAGLAALIIDAWPRLRTTIRDGSS